MRIKNVALSLIALGAFSGQALAQCSAGEVEVTIEVETDAYGYETYWELVPAGNACGTGTIFSGGNTAVGCNGAAAQNQTPGGYGDNLTITEGPFCLTLGASYDIIWVDDWGDGGLNFWVTVDGFDMYQFAGTGAGETFTFEASPPMPDDAGVTAIVMPGYLGDGTHDVKAKVKNYGSNNITSVDLSWIYNNGATNTETVTGLNIAPFEEVVITHGTPLTVINHGSFDIEVFTGDVNGNADSDNSNDAMTKSLEVGPSIPNHIDDYIGANTTLTVIADNTDGLSTPRDLDFHPYLTRKEVWVINKGTENSGGTTVTIMNAGEANQTSELLQDGNAWHFMSLPTGIAFSDNTNFATSAGVYDANHNGGEAFTGPSLWSSDLAIYAQPSGGNGSHIDMLHASPETQGIAHEADNAFWVFDGYNNDIVKYDFNEDHGPGNDDHSDGEIWRYSDVTVAKDPGDHIVSHLVMDKTNGWLYVVDHGNDRIIRMDVNTGTAGPTPTFGPYEPLATYESVTGYTWETVVSTGLVEPSGIDIIDDRMIVSDHSNGDIIIYDISSMPATELGRITSGSAGVMGVKIGPDGKIWYVNANTNEVLRVEALGLSVQEQPELLDFKLYPNPAGDVVQIAAKNSSWKGGTVTITDATGKLVKAFNNYQGTALDIKDLASGMYFVNLSDTEQSYKVQRLVVQ